jgi:hypothetical protein
MAIISKVCIILTPPLRVRGHSVIPS